MNIKQKITTAAIIAGMMAGVVAPASFAKVKIKNNGAGSVNGVAKVNLTKKVVAQGNFTYAGTFVGTSTKTGGNTSNANTGNGTSVETGKATTTTSVATIGGDNSNTANGESCCCNGEDETNVAITGNGAGSFNGVFLLSACKNVVMQGNETVSETMIVSNTGTGGNSANANTGGTTTVTTGNATTTTTVITTGGSNTNN